MRLPCWIIAFIQNSVTSWSVSRPKQVLGLGLKGEDEDNSDPGEDRIITFMDENTRLLLQDCASVADPPPGGSHSPAPAHCLWQSRMGDSTWSGEETCSVFICKYFFLFARNEISGTVYNYSLYHTTLCLANMYITMQLTQWFQPQVSFTLLCLIICGVEDYFTNTNDTF